LDAGFTRQGAILASTFPADWFEPLAALADVTFVHVCASRLLPETRRGFNLKVVLSTPIGAGLIPTLGGLRGV
jgi:hypothetical protein